MNSFKKIVSFLCILVFLFGCIVPSYSGAMVTDTVPPQPAAEPPEQQHKQEDTETSSVIDTSKDKRIAEPSQSAAKLSIPVTREGDTATLSEESVPVEQDELKKSDDEHPEDVDVIETTVLVVGGKNSGKTKLIEKLCNSEAAWYTNPLLAGHYELSYESKEEFDSYIRLTFHKKSEKESERYKVKFIESTFENENLKNYVKSSSVVFLILDSQDSSTFEGNFAEERFMQIIKAGGKKNSFYLQVVITTEDEGKCVDAFSRFRRSHLGWGEFTHKLTKFSREMAVSVGGDGNEERIGMLFGAIVGWCKYFQKGRCLFM